MLFSIVSVVIVTVISVISLKFGKSIRDKKYQDRKWWEILLEIQYTILIEFDILQIGFIFFIEMFFIFASFIICTNLVYFSTILYIWGMCCTLIYVEKIF